jgi:choline dehydrogenase-like flavoprotein
MLSSGIGKPYDPKTGTGTVGRNFCYQLINSINLFFDKNTYINQFMGSGGVGQAIEDFNADNFDHGPLGFIGGGIIWGRQTGNGPVRGIPLPKGSPSWGSGWKAAVKENFLQGHGRHDRSLSLGQPSGRQRPDQSARKRWRWPWALERGGHRHLAQDRDHPAIRGCRTDGRGRHPQHPTYDG